MCVFFFCVFFFFLGGVEGEFGVCVFVCVVSSAAVCPLSRDGLFVRHRHKIIRLVVVCLWSVLSCLSLFVTQRGDLTSMAAVSGSLVFLQARQIKKLPSLFYSEHLWFCSFVILVLLWFKCHVLLEWFQTLLDIWLQSSSFTVLGNLEAKMKNFWIVISKEDEIRFL